MEVFRGVENRLGKIARPVVTIGNFDGVHLGHQEIIRCAIAKARSRNGNCVAFTFRPHPQVALRPDVQLSLLLTYDEKLQILGSLGVDITIEEPFSRQFSTTEPEQFFKETLIGRLGAEVIVGGYDFAFGRERHGHLQALGTLCESFGVELIVVAPLSRGDEVVSSSRIRTHLMTGRIEQANSLLGRQFSYQGVVVRGEARGRQLGFPTANLKIEPKLNLPLGVYATWAVLGHEIFPSVTNVGVRPTFHSSSQPVSQALVETHLFNPFHLPLERSEENSATGGSEVSIDPSPGESRDLYGATLEVRFVRYLREERKFSGIDSLKVQIRMDSIEAKKSLRG